MAERPTSGGGSIGGEPVSPPAEAQPVSEGGQQIEEVPPVDPEWEAKAATRPSDHIFVTGEDRARETFQTELDRTRATRASAKIAAEEEKQRLLAGPKAFIGSSHGHQQAEAEGSSPDNPIRLSNIFSAPQVVTFKLAKLPAMRDVFLTLDMGKLPTALAVLPATFEPDSDAIGPKAKHLGNLAATAASASLRLYMSDQYHSKAADYRWQEEMGMLNPSLVGAGDKNSAAATGDESGGGPVKSKLLGPATVTLHKSFALPYSKSLGFSGNTSENLCNTPVIALKELTGNFYFALFSNVALANVEIYCRVNQRVVRDEDNLCHPWRISRMFTVNPFSHDAFVEWFNKNKTALTLGATSLIEPATRMNPLHVAMGYLADPRIVRLMIKHCGKFVKLNALDAEGQSPIFKLVRRADVSDPSSLTYYRALELIRIMAVDAGCYLDLQDDEGNTVMHYAARHHKAGSQLFARLLEYGAQADMRNAAGRTPVEEAEAFGGVLDPVSGNVIPRILPLDLREVRQLLAAAEASKRRQQEEEMSEMTRRVVREQSIAIDESGFFDASRSRTSVAAASRASISVGGGSKLGGSSSLPPSPGKGRSVVVVSGDALPLPEEGGGGDDAQDDEERYPTSAILRLKKERDAKELRQHLMTNPPPGPEDAQIHMGHMRMVAEGSKRTIRTQWTMPKPLMPTGLGEEGAAMLFPTRPVRMSKRTGKPRLVRDGAIYEEGAGDSCSSDDDEASRARETHLATMTSVAALGEDDANITARVGRVDGSNSVARRTVMAELYEPPAMDTGAVFVPFPKRVPSHDLGLPVGEEGYSPANASTNAAMASTYVSDLNLDMDANTRATVTSALDQEVAALNRRRRGEADLLPSYAKRRQLAAKGSSGGPKPFVSSIPQTDRSYSTYMEGALGRAGQLSYRPSPGIGDTAGSSESREVGQGVLAGALRLPPIDGQQQSALHGSLLQKRLDATRGRTLEECMATAETQRRNHANARNEGTINIPSYDTLRSFTAQKQALSTLRSGKGLPTHTRSTEDERLRALLEGGLTREETHRLAEEDAFRITNPDYVTLGGFRGSYGLDSHEADGTSREWDTSAKALLLCNTSSAAGNSPVRGASVGVSPIHNRSNVSMGDQTDALGRHLDLGGVDALGGGNALLSVLEQQRRAGLAERLRARRNEASALEEADVAPEEVVLSPEEEARQARLYQVRSAVSTLNDATNIPTHVLLRLQEEYNTLERKEGRGYLTVGQVVNVVKAFDGFGVPRSDREIEELVRLGGVKRAHRHHLKHKALGSNIVPPDAITFNDYCAVMLQLNKL